MNIPFLFQIFISQTITIHTSAVKEKLANGNVRQRVHTAVVQAASLRRVISMQILCWPE